MSALFLWFVLISGEVEPSAKSIDQLIEQLGSAKFTEREAATA